MVSFCDITFCSATLYVTCFCHSAFCSLLFFFVCFFKIVIICGNIFTINLHVLFTSLYFPLMNSQSLSLYEDTLLSPSVCQAICFIVLLIYFVSVVTIYFPVLFSFDFPYGGCNPYSLYHSSLLSSTMYPSLLPLLYSLMSPDLFVFCFLLWLKVIYLYISSSVKPFFSHGIPVMIYI